MSMALFKQTSISASTECDKEQCANGSTFGRVLHLESGIKTTTELQNLNKMTEFAKIVQTNKNRAATPKDSLTTQGAND
jgi:hypothetical protein